MTYVHRKELVHRINTIINGSVAEGEREARPSPYKLMLLHGPAGYGKTMLLVDFAQQTSLPCCWYFLDRTDTDCITFLTVLLTSIRQRFPDFGAALDPLLVGPSSERANNPRSVNYFEWVVDTLVTAMETEISERFAILLCNYQEVNELLEINALVGYLLQKLPQQCVLIIESRVIPNLDFAQMLARQMIASLGISHLRFTASQIHELVRLQGVEPLTDIEAEQLAFTFDGWIAGILLSTRLSNLQQSLTEPLFVDASERQATSQYLFSYVVNEVFKSHQAAYAFLKEACILHEMTVPLCANLLDISPAHASMHLRYLEQQNLFVTHSGEGPDIVYICTPVLRKLLYEQLRYEAPERFSHLHQRAAELLSASNNYSQAISHALEASHYEIAARLIIESTELMINQGHAATMARWIDTFPNPMTNRYPQLLLMRAHIYLMQGDHRSAVPLLEAAHTAVQATASTSSPLDILTLKAEIAIVRSKVLFQQREYRQGQIICQQILSSLPADEIMLRADAQMRLGLCSILLGDFTAGIAQIQKALQLWGRHTIRQQTAYGHSALANAYSLLGNFSLAEHHITRALACWDQLQDIWGKIDNFVTLGNIKLRQGAIEEAETIFQEALTQARDPLRYLRGQAYILSSLSVCYQHQGYYERALEMAEEALALARQISDYFLANSVLCDLAMIYLAMGDTATAMILISEVEIQTTSGEPIGYKIAVRNLIYGTIYLSQGQYSQAWPYLSESEAILNKIGLKEEYLQVLLRLAAYYLTQGQFSDTVLRLQTATAIIPICEGYERLALREVRQFPELHHVLKTHPELTQIRTLLHLKPELQITSEEPPPVQESPAQSASPASEVRLLPHRLTILALGEPIVYLHQKPVTQWRMARAMELFFYLLDCGRPMRKDQIITALWPEIDEHTTRTFYSTIYYLRQALGGESVIVAKRGTYALRLDSLYGKEVWYDVIAFEEAQTLARHALNEGNDVVTKEYYLTMVDLYHGDYVQPFYSDWCSSRRDELRNAYLEARHQLAQITWRAEQFDESIVHWQQILALDNWTESAHYGLMRCYARQGKRGLALRQYQRCKDILKQEFGTIPGAAIQNLYQRLMGSL